MAEFLNPLNVVLSRLVLSKLAIPISSTISSHPKSQLPIPGGSIFKGDIVFAGGIQ